MPRRDYFETGDAVPKDGEYKTFCDNTSANLTDEEQFPPCPTCNLATAWRPT